MPLRATMLTGRFDQPGPLTGLSKANCSFCRPASSSAALTAWAAATIFAVAYAGGAAPVAGAPARCATTVATPAIAIPNTPSVSERRGSERIMILSESHNGRLRRTLRLHDGQSGFHSPARGRRAQGSNSDAGHGRDRRGVFPGRTLSARRARIHRNAGAAGAYADGREEAHLADHRAAAGSWRADRRRGAGGAGGTGAGRRDR